MCFNKRVKTVNDKFDVGEGDKSNYGKPDVAKITIKLSTPKQIFKLL